MNNYIVLGYLVIKTLAYFPSNAAQNSAPVIRAMLESAQDAGITCRSDDLDCDATLIWSVLWHGRMQNNRKIYDHYRSLGRPVIIAEVGCLRRNITWKVAVNHITRDGYYGHEQDIDHDRPRRLGLRLSRTSGTKILIAAQHSQSLQAAGISDMTQWIIEQIHEIRSYSDRAIVIRPHPRDRLKYFSLPQDVTLQFPLRVPNTYDSFNWSSDYHAIVNYNSGPGVQAAIDGVRPVVHNSSLAWPVSVGIKDIEQPYNLDRDTWFAQLCHTEYTIDELAGGLWLKRLCSAL